MPKKPFFASAHTRHPLTSLINGRERPNFKRWQVSMLAPYFERRLSCRISPGFRSNRFVVVESVSSGMSSEALSPASSEARSSPFRWRRIRGDGSDRSRRRSESLINLCSNIDQALIGPTLCSVGFNRHRTGRSLYRDSACVNNKNALRSRILVTFCLSYK
jgi:hypothetical protein